MLHCNITTVISRLETSLTSRSRLEILTSRSRLGWWSQGLGLGRWTSRSRLGLEVLRLVPIPGWHPQIRTGQFCWSKVLLTACSCWQHPVHLIYGEDARILNGIAYTISVVRTLSPYHVHKISKLYQNTINFIVLQHSTDMQSTILI